MKWVYYSQVLEDAPARLEGSHGRSRQSADRESGWGLVPLLASVGGVSRGSPKAGLVSSSQRSGGWVHPVGVLSGGHCGEGSGRQGVLGTGCWRNHIRASVCLWLGVIEGTPLPEGQVCGGRGLCGFGSLPWW